MSSCSRSSGATAAPSPKPKSLFIRAIIAGPPFVSLHFPFSGGAWTNTVPDAPLDGPARNGHCFLNLRAAHRVQPRGRECQSGSFPEVIGRSAAGCVGEERCVAGERGGMCRSDEG